MTKTNHAAAAGILHMMESEAEARHEYEEFLDRNPDLASSDMYAIREIERDETNHLLILQAMVKRYDGGIAASPDGTEKALMEIAYGVEIDSQ